MMVKVEFGIFSSVKLGFCQFFGFIRKKKLAVKIFLMNDFHLFGNDGTMTIDDYCTVILHELYMKG